MPPPRRYNHAHELQVEALDPREIVAFTKDAGYKTSFIPAGTLFLPPEDNVDPSDRPWRPDGSLPEKVRWWRLADLGGEGAGSVAAVSDVKFGNFTSLKDARHTRAYTNTARWGRD